MLKWYQSHSCVIREGGENLIEDDESPRGMIVTIPTTEKININHRNTLGKSHIGRGQERSLVHK